MLVLRACQSILQFRNYAVDDDAGPRVPAFEVKKSGQKIKIKLNDAATGIFTPTTCLALRERNRSLSKILSRASSICKSVCAISVPFRPQGMDQ